MADSFHDEEILGKAYDSRLMRRLLVYLRPYWGMTLFALVAILLYGILQALPPYLLKVEVDRYLDPSARASLPKFLSSYLSSNPMVGIAQIALVEKCGRRCHARPSPTPWPVGSRLPAHLANSRASRMVTFTTG